MDLALLVIPLMIIELLQEGMMKVAAFFITALAAIAITFVVYSALCEKKSVELEACRIVNDCR
jgi:hypothetical protein